MSFKDRLRVVIAEDISNIIVNDHFKINKPFLIKFTTGIQQNWEYQYKII